MPGENIERVAELESQVTDLEGQLEALSRQLEEAKTGNPDVAKQVDLQAQLDESLNTMQELTKALEETLAKNSALEKALTIEKGMSDKEREFCKEWDDDKKEEFASMDPEKRKKKMEEAEADDETVEVEKQLIRKSVVGEAQFNIMKAQADRIAKAEQVLADEINKRRMAEFAKRADDEYAHVPGSTEDRANILKALADMDETLRKSFEAVLTQSEKLGKSAFDTLGHKGGTKGSAQETFTKAAIDFENKVSDIASRDKIGKTAALTKARKQYPDLFKAYQESQEAN